jgi:hypothetical protein
MRAIGIGVVLSVFAFLGAAAQTPTPTASSPQALQILRQSLAALSPNIAVQDVTLSGSVHYTPGSGDETGTAELRVTTHGSARVDLTLPSGNLREIYNFNLAKPAAEWFDKNGARHAIPTHNIIGEPGWFSPVTAIARRLLDQQYVATYVGSETLDTQTVHHISIAAPDGSSFALYAHLTQIELYIDSTTFLPAALSYNTHADDNALVDIPVFVRYSDFRPANGANFPFHIQKFLNGFLILDIQLDSAAANTGVPASTFGL